MRVDRGDETELDSKGKRKQFDIIVEVPVQLLSCRCNPEWMSLPTYSLFPLDTSQSQSYGCVCQANNPHRQNNSNGGNDALHSLDMDYLILGGAGIARASGGFTPRPPEHPLRADQTPLVRGPDALDDRNRQYAALVSGIEREDGERPPTYEDATVY
ncbi:hypothetical protein FRB99_001502 [Tulasnella sp. 403]|nr:hypothetical protein FRB99_001502 [Tulasnella sp. 403]